MASRTTQKDLGGSGGDDGDDVAVDGRGGDIAGIMSVCRSGQGQLPGSEAG